MKKRKASAPEVFVAMDFGTGTIYIPVRYEDGRIEFIPDLQNDCPTPAAIGFEGGDPAKVLIGRSALSYRMVHPEHVSVINKRMRGEGVVVLVDKDNRTWTGEELDTELVRVLFHNIEERTGLPIRAAAVSVPACFDDAKRKQTINIIEAAGYQCVGVIHEPTAAILGYLKDKAEHMKVLVLDVGTGTSDCTLAEVTERNNFKIRATAGRNDLAGKEMTLCLVQRCVEAMTAKGVTCTPESNLRDFVLMENCCEEGKVSLSTVNTTYLTWRVDAELFELEITREEFQRLITPLLNDIRELVLETLAMAKLDASQIDAVVPVGGGCRVPAIRNLLAEMFGEQKIRKDVDCEKAVALGAAESIGLKILEAIEQGDQALADDAPDYAFQTTMKLLDILGSALGVKATNEQTDQEEFVAILPEQTTLPFTATRRFNISSTHGDVDIVILQGKSGCSLDKARMLAMYSLKSLAPGPKKGRIKVTFTIDSNGTVTIHAVDTHTGREIKESLEAKDIVIQQAS